MIKLLAVLLMGLAAKAEASNSYDNSTIINAVAVSTGVPTAPVKQSPYSLMIDLASADSASWQMSITCAKGSIKLQQSNDGVNFVDLNVAGSSVTFYGGGLTTSSNNLYAIANPAYRYVNFVITNSSAPVNNVVASNCTATVKQLLKSITPRVN